MTVGHYQKQLECGFVPWTNPFSGCFCVKTSLLRLPPKYVFFKTGRRLRSTWSFYKDNSCSCCASGQPDVLVELNQRLRKRPIYLVGMMGSGKSTIGQCLASKLSYSFLDTDQVIEQVEQKKITQIFEQDGEDKFREVESNILNQIQPCLGYVVATGGGIVLRSSNWSILRSGVVVFLDITVSTIMKRLLNDTSRPLLQGSEPQRRLEEIRRRRLPLYKQADIHIQLNDSHIEQEFTQEQWTDLITKQLFEFLTTQQYGSSNILQ